MQKLPSQEPERAGCRTEGITVERRFWSVDILEWLLTLGKLEHVFGEVVKSAGLRPGQRLLDLGCGTGALVRLAAAQCPAGDETELWGLDATPQMVERAKARSAAHGSDDRVRFVLGVCESLPFEDGHFDVVTSTFLYHHLPPALKVRTTAQVRRVLKPGGRFVLCDYDRPRSALDYFMWAPLRLFSNEYLTEHWQGRLPDMLVEAGLTLECARSSGASRVGLFVATKGD